MHHDQAWLAGQFGVDNPYLRFPELSAAVVAFTMAAPMVAWMRFRATAWNLIAQMSWAMVAQATLIVVAYWFGVLRNEAVGGISALRFWQHGLMMPFMLIAMFLRLDDYTGGTYPPDRLNHGCGHNRGHAIAQVKEVHHDARPRSTGAANRQTSRDPTGAPVPAGQPAM